MSTKKKETREVTVRDQEIAPSLPALAQAERMMQMIMDASKDPSIDANKMRVMWELYKEAKNEKAEQEFDEAVKRIEMKLPRIVKRGVVKYDVDSKDKSKGQAEAFKFAKYEDVDSAIRPLLKEEGFTLSFTSDWRDGGGLIMHAKLSHKAGHTRTASLPLALDSSGGKNNVQAAGSTSSYGRRYLCYLLFNIVTVGEDDDGEGAHDLVSIDEAADMDNELNRKDDDVSVHDKASILKFLGVGSARDIKAKDLKKAQMIIRGSAVEYNQKKKAAANA